MLEDGPEHIPFCPRMKALLSTMPLPRQGSRRRSNRRVLWSVVLLQFAFSSGPSAHLSAQATGDPGAESAIIAGTVFSAETGQALPKVTIALYSGQTEEGGRPLSVGTNEKGQYIIEDVAPGRYRIFASRNGFVRQAYARNLNEGHRNSGAPIVVGPGQILREINFHLIPAAVIEGRIVDEDHEPLARSKVSLSRARWVQGKRTLVSVANAGTDDRGVYRLFGIPPGSYYLSATYRQFEMPKGQGERPVLTYYPGVANLFEATRIDIPAGAQYSSGDLILQKAQTFDLRGTAVDSRGRGFGAVRIYSRRQNQEGWSSEPTGHTRTDEDGNFELKDLLPGEYRLAAYSNQDGQAFIGSASVTLGSEDARGVVVRVGAGADVEGSLSSEDPEAHLDAGQISVYVIPEEIASPVFLERSSEVTEGGGFRISQIPPGPSRFAVALPPGGFYVKSIRLGGMQVVDQSFTLAVDQRAEDTKILVSAEAAEIVGIARDRENRVPVAGAAVILFSADRKNRFLHSRFTKKTQTDQEGRFTLDGIVPGKYLICGITGHGPGSETSSSYLTAVEDSCRRIELDASEKFTSDVFAFPAPAQY